MTRLWSHLVRLACVGLVLPALHGAWDSPSFGTPVVEVFRSQQTGLSAKVRCATQDPRTGLLFFGSESGLATFDGTNWKLHPGTSKHGFLTLSFDPEGGRLWSGSVGTIGYVDLAAPEDLRWVELGDKLPFPAAELNVIWSCFAGKAGVDFVATQRVLRWDGSRFQSWDFPTKNRLFPIRFEGALWFHHPESGLYRMSSAGPEKIAGTDQLLNSSTEALFTLHRDAQGLFGRSNAGLQRIGPSPHLVMPDAVAEFTRTGSIIRGTPIPAGFAISTLRNGLAIVSPDGKILRTVGANAGLGGRHQGHFLDRDGDLWIFTDTHLARVPASGSTSLVRFPEAPSDTGVSQLRLEHDQTLWAATGWGVYQITPGAAAGEPLQITPSALKGANYFATASTAHGLLGLQFKAIELVDHSGARSTLTTEVLDPWLALPLRSRPDHILLLGPRGQSELAREPGGGWRVIKHEAVSAARPFLSQAAEDAAGNVWVASPSSPPTYLRRVGEQFEIATPPELPNQMFRGNHNVFARLQDVLLVVDRRLFLAESGGRVRDLGYTLPEGAAAMALSPDRARLYCKIHRPSAPRGYTLGVGSLEIDATGRIGRWREFLVPGLALVDNIDTLAVTSEAGSDTLWIGGKEGLLQARVAELSEWRPPGSPHLTLLSGDTPATTTEFPSQHRVRFNLRAAEVSLRPAIRYQTRLGDDRAPWSSPSDRTTWEFSDLREGTYTFAARTINPLGQTSEPTLFSFTILPPWYRTGWAYAAYFALALGATAGAIRYREARIRARNEELEKLVLQRTEELEKANAAKDEFLASMSHEIRNPMNGVVGLSAAIDTATLDPEGQHRFDLLRHCAAHLATLLEDILDFTRLQSGRVDLHEQPLAPTELLESVVAITSADSAAVGMPVKTALAPNVPAHVTGDARRLRQILLNFVSNALKYAGRGEIELTVWGRPAGPGRVELTFAVTDDGPGIPPEEQAKVFTKFERGYAARQARIPGTGMGLAVCRTLAERMGGRVWLESEPGHGSTFYLAVPLAIASGPAPESTATADRPSQEQVALIVDDEEYNRIALATLLTRHGFVTRTAHDGRSALSLAAAERFDLICLDYDMPDMQGPELARRLRALHATRSRQPILLATTAYTTVEKRDECLAAGMDAFLGKPVSAERVREALAVAHSQRSSHPPVAIPALAPEPAPAPLEPEDPLLANLRVVADSQQLPLDRIAADFAAECAREFATLHEALIRSDAHTSGRAAHQLAGRFGFLRARAAAELALELERCCRANQWEPAARLATELAAAWDPLHASLIARSADPAGSDRS